MAQLRKAEPPATVEGDLPAELRLCVIETWCPDPDDPHVKRLMHGSAYDPSDPAEVSHCRAIVALSRWTEARLAWAEANGVSRRDLYERFVGRHTPLSWDYLTERDPELLARILSDHGLPPDWTPDV